MCARTLVKLTSESFHLPAYTSVETEVCDELNILLHIIYGDVLIQSSRLQLSTLKPVHGR